MSGALTRRDFLRALVLGAGAAALPIVREVFARAPQIEQPLTLSRSSWVPGIWPLDGGELFGIKAKSFTPRRVGSRELTFNPPDAPRWFYDHEAERIAIEHITSKPWHCVWITGITADVGAVDLEENRITINKSRRDA